jgi:lipopolysaccharide export system protein LptC
MELVSVAPLSAERPRKPRGPPFLGRHGMESSRPRPAPTPGRIARRRFAVGLAKRLLPVVAVALLTLVALWPDLDSDTQRARFSYRRGGVDAQSGELITARYNGVDEHGRPYTMTAVRAHQLAGGRVDLVSPKADVTLESGNWLMVQSRKGVYMTRDGQLDLSGDVVIYRDDGTTITTDAAAVDLHAAAAAGSDQVHADGPFGTLDAQGFALTDRGRVLQFQGPGRLVLNGGSK